MTKQASPKRNPEWDAARNEAHDEGRWYTPTPQAPKGSKWHRPHGARA